MSMEKRCECCDGPDGLGVYHVRGSIERLARFVRGKGGPMPISYEPSRRIAIEFASVEEAEEFVSDELERQALEYQEDRRSWGLR